MKALIINGSPRKNGECFGIMQKMLPNLSDDSWVVNVFHESKIEPCNDCRACSRLGECVKNDDMHQVLEDNYDTVIIISPIHMLTLPAPMLALASRFQADYMAKRMGKQIKRSPKRGFLILVGGGDGEPSHALKIGKLILSNLNAKPNDEDIFMSLNTDTVPALEDDAFVARLKERGLIDG